MFLRAIPKHTVYLPKRGLRLIIALLLKGKLLEGSCIFSFEKEFSRYIGVKHSICVSSGRVALYLILKSLKLNEGDEVLLPSFTFHAVPSIITTLKLKPVFVDINEKTLNIDVKLIERGITSKTRAIIATHLFGQPSEMDKILKIARRYNLKVIEDCAQSCGSFYKNKKTGGIGDFGYFSLSSIKNLNTFGGGIITTNDNKHVKHIRNEIIKFKAPSNIKIILSIMRGYLIRFFTLPVIFGFTIYPILFIMSFFTNKDIIFGLMKEKKQDHYDLDSLNIKYTNVQAEIGLKQLGRLDYLNQIQIKHAKYLTSLLKCERNIEIIKSIPSIKNIYYQYTVKVKNNKRDRLYLRLLRKGIDSRKEYCQDCNGLLLFNNYKSTCNISEKIKNEILHIPAYSSLKFKDIRYIAKTLKSLSMA